MKLNQKQMMIAGGILLVIIVLFGLRYLMLKKAKVNNSDQTTQSDGVVPTIDGSVDINLTTLTGKKEVLLSIKNIPAKTTGLEYILSYETVEGGLQGVNSTADITGSSFEKKITLGTCSSGTCVYHNIKGKIKVELIFKGASGDRYFTKEYAI